MYQNDVLKERAKNMALDYNFVTDLTSLVVRIDDGSRNSKKKIFRSGGSGDGSSQGMSTPIDTTFNVSSLIKPEENSKPCGPCNITLYSAEHYDGDDLNLCTSVPDLSLWDFEEKLESLKVEGACDWEIFSGETLSLSHSLPLCDS